MPYACLILERSADTAQGLQRELAALDFRPHSVGSCDAALTLMAHWSFDAIVVDARSIGPHYTVALEQLRRLSCAPVMVLAQAGDEASQLDALEAGASDIVALPASARLISAKLRRLVEAAVQPRPAAVELKVGPLVMNARSATARIGDRALALTGHQFELLYLLARRPGQFMQRDAIVRALHSRAACGGRSVDVQVYRIRKALRATGAAGLRLDTIHGRGYSLWFDAAADDASEGLPGLGGWTAARSLPPAVHAAPR